MVRRMSKSLPDLLHDCNWEVVSPFDCFILNYVKLPLTLYWYMRKWNSTDGVTPSRTILFETTLVKTEFGSHRYILGHWCFSCCFSCCFCFRYSFFLKFLGRLNYYFSIHKASTVIYQYCYRAIFLVQSLYIVCSKNRKRDLGDQVRGLF